MAQNHINTRLFYRYSLLATVLLLTPIVSLAQSGGGIDSTGTGGRHSIIGRLIFPSGQRADLRLKIQIGESGRRRPDCAFRCKRQLHFPIAETG